MRIVIILFHTILLVFKGISVHAKYCVGKAPVINVCEDNELIMQRNIYVDIGSIPNFQPIQCKCTITPLVSSTNTAMITIQTAGKLPEDINFSFRIKDSILDDQESFSFLLIEKIKAETDFVFTSSNNTGYGVCLQVKRDDEINMTCKDNKKQESTEATTLDVETTANTEATSTVSSENQVISSDDEDLQNGIDLVQIGIITGGGFGAILVIVTVAMVLVRCRRKRESNPEVRKSIRKKSPNVESEGKVYVMQPNPAYEHADDVLKIDTSADEDHYTEPEFTDYNESSSQYDYTSFAAANNTSQIHAVQHPDDNTYDRTNASTSGTFTGNVYNRVPMNRTVYKYDSDNYNVLNQR